MQSNLAGFFKEKYKNFHDKIYESVEEFEEDMTFYPGVKVTKMWHDHDVILMEIDDHEIWSETVVLKNIENWDHLALTVATLKSKAWKSFIIGTH